MMEHHVLCIAHQWRHAKSSKSAARCVAAPFLLLDRWKPTVNAGSRRDCIVIRQAATVEAFVISKAGKAMVRVLSIEAASNGPLRRVGFPKGRVALPEEMFQPVGAALRISCVRQSQFQSRQKCLFQIQGNAVQSWQPNRLRILTRSGDPVVTCTPTRCASCFAATGYYAT